MGRGIAACGLLVVCASASCGSSLGMAVALTLEVDATVTNEQLASVKSLGYTVTGDETYGAVKALGRAMMREERVVYRPEPNSRTIVMTVSALDESLNVIATGSSGPVPLGIDKAVDVTITLSRPGLDLGSGDSRSDDLRVVDLSVPNADFEPRRDLSSGDAGGSGMCPGVTCYTFEHDAEDDSASLGTTAGCSVKKDGTAHGGTAYLECTATATDTYLIANANVGTGQNQIYERAFLRISTVGTAIYANFGGLYNTTAGDYLMMGTVSNGNFGVNYSNGEVDSNTPVSDSGKWDCLEMLVDRSATPSVTLWLNGVMQGVEANITVPASYTSVEVGIVKVAQGKDVAITADWDDVVIGNGRIGCN